MAAQTMPGISLSWPSPSLLSTWCLPHSQHYYAATSGYQFQNNHNPQLLLSVQTETIQSNNINIPRLKTSSPNLAANASTPLKPISKSQANNNINSFCKEGRLKDALAVLRIMELQGISLDFNACFSLLEACCNAKSLVDGREVHAHMVINGLEEDEFLGTKLVNMYVMCGLMEHARQVFDKMPERNVRLWNGILRGYACSGFLEETLEVFYQMQWAERVKPNSFTFPFVLKACAGLSAVRKGKEVHGHIVRSGFESDVYVGTALVDMYAKCRSLKVARRLFDKMSQRNVVSWNAMIAGYAHNGHGLKALELFRDMHTSDVKANSVTVLSLLWACACLGDQKRGKCIHGYIIRSGIEVDDYLGSAIVDMYAKCRNVEVARRSFDSLSQKGLVSWTAMIAGYAQNGCFGDALRLFHQMSPAGLKPNSVTMVSVLPACAHLGILQQGKQIHAYIIKKGHDAENPAENSLIAMYSKCGHLHDAHCVFKKMLNRDVASWNAMITGYGMHGLAKDALQLFLEMQQSGLKPNHITFLCVLSACSHAGLVDEGWQYFNCMSRDFEITPRMEHYACMVDLLGRAGHLDDANLIINKMPLKPDATVWGALLGACRIHCNVQLAKRATKWLLHLEPENAGSYVLLANIYAAAGKWERVAKVRRLLKNRWLRKRQGSSWIESRNKVHVFLARDKTHPQTDKIYALLDSFTGQMEKEGYLTDINLHDMEEETDFLPCSHSEKLAIAFGLMNTSPGTPVRVTKNLRICESCHSTAKFISGFVKREIIVRDINRFHHFCGGSCSCRDYW